MFSLVIVLISIVLVGAIAAAVIYFGGSAFTGGGDKAKATQAVNEAQQVKGALEVYKVQTGNVATSLTQLAPDYLKAAPTAWGTIDGYAYSSQETLANCKAVNALYGINTVPDCTDPAYTGVPVCCSVSQ